MTCIFTFFQSSSSENLPGGSGFIQPDRFTYLTLTIISGTLTMGILFPQGNHSACVSDISWTKNFALQMWTLGCNFVVSYSVYKDSAEVPLLVVCTNLLLLLPWKRSGEESGWWWFWYFFCVIVEFVLALTGATMGTLIAFVFPSCLFLRAVSEKTNTRLIAKVGCWCNGLMRSWFKGNIHAFLSQLRSQ